MQQFPKSSQHLGALAPLLRGLLKAGKSQVRSLRCDPENEKERGGEKQEVEEAKEEEAELKEEEG